MTVVFHALLMLTALSAVVFAAAAASRPRRLAALGVGCLVAAPVSAVYQASDPEAAGLLAAAGALLYLFAPHRIWLGVLLGGAVAGMSTGVLSTAGVPSLLALPLAPFVMIATAWLTRRRADFAPESLREEALLGTGLLGLVVALLPSVLDGWQAAANLNIRPDTPAAQAIPAWALAVVIGSTCLGSAFALWSRR